jgi:hypothetical protein
MSGLEGVEDRDMRSDPIALVHAERLFPLGAAGGGVPTRGVVRTEFHPLETLGAAVLAGAAVGEARGGARKSASFPSVVPVEELCERRFGGIRVSMRRISCTLR